MDVFSLLTMHPKIAQNIARLSRLDVPGEEIDGARLMWILVHRGQPAALQDAHDEARVLTGLGDKKPSKSMVVFSTWAQWAQRAQWDMRIVS